MNEDRRGASQKRIVMNSQNEKKSNERKEKSRDGEREKGLEGQSFRRLNFVWNRRDVYYPVLMSGMIII